MRANIALLSLHTFSVTGGIQKMTRTLSYCLNNIAAKHNLAFELLSIYDRDEDIMTQYLPAASFRGFRSDRVKFIFAALKTGRYSNTIILSHINMAIVGLAIKLLNPECRVMLIAHGIEVWRPLSFFKRMFLKKCDMVICVSEFTRTELTRLHDLPSQKSIVINNAIDPFIKLPTNLNKPTTLLKRYGLTGQDPILFTLARLANTEQYKGYDQVIKILGDLKSQFKQLKYVLAGPYDKEEKQRIQQLIDEHNAEESIILPGFIAENELADHFLMADLFILPSKKEGFGIVFIEAMACGLPVICGNTDGSIDAVKNGKLGTAISPENTVELKNEVAKHLQNPASVIERARLQQECLSYYNADAYMQKFEDLLMA